MEKLSDRKDRDVEKYLEREKKRENIKLVNNTIDLLVNDKRKKALCSVSSPSNWDMNSFRYGFSRKAPSLSISRFVAYR